MTTSQKGGGFGKAEFEIHHLHGLGSRALHEVVDGGHDDDVFAVRRKADVAEGKVRDVVQFRQRVAKSHQGFPGIGRSVGSGNFFARFFALSGRRQTGGDRFRDGGGA